MAEHPNALVVRRLVAAMSEQNRAEIETIVDENCIWRVPGANVLSGVYEGRRAILSLFGKMKRIFTGPARRCGSANVSSTVSGTDASSRSTNSSPTNALSMRRSPRRLSRPRPHARDEWRHRPHDGPSRRTGSRR